MGGCRGSSLSLSFCCARMDAGCAGCARALPLVLCHALCICSLLRASPFPPPFSLFFQLQNTAHSAIHLNPAPPHRAPPPPLSSLSSGSRSRVFPKASLMASLGARRRRRAPAAESSSGRVEVEVIMVEVEVEDSPLFFSFYKSNTTKLRNKIFLGLPQKAPRSSLSLLSLVLVLLVGYFGRRLNFLFGCFFFTGRRKWRQPAHRREDDVWLCARR